MNYQDFLRSKEYSRKQEGFEPLWLPEFLFPFQRDLVDWAIRIGKGALYEDCGLGKSCQQLVWAENVLRKTNKSVLILAPLAVSSQTVREAAKFGMKIYKTKTGAITNKKINITNYESLHHFRPEDFSGVVLDESSAIKHMDSKTCRKITEFLKIVPYRLLCTATPAPNDYMELGTSSEALGVMSRNSMLGCFFTNDGESTQHWTLKGHAKKRFWQWVGTWARAIRKPSDFGYEDGKFTLPPLNVEKKIIRTKRKEGLFAWIAKTLEEQRHERKSTVKERCELVAEHLPKDEPAFVGCHLNSEGDLLEKLIPGAVQVSGADKDEVKEERLEAFCLGQVRVLISKPKVASFGLNLQHCRNVSYFPSHSHEQYYQWVRRCWRFGQKNPVNVLLVYTEAQSKEAENMLTKEKNSVEIFSGIIRHMNEGMKRGDHDNGSVQMELPKWLRQ